MKKYIHPYTKYITNLLVLMLVVFLSVQMEGNAQCSSPISPGGHSLNFETSSLNGWTQLTWEDMDWTRRSGSTPSNYTGPSSAQEGLSYLYMEATSNYEERAIIQSPCFSIPPTGQSSFRFYYHMLGSDMGQLRVRIATGNSNSWTTIWSRSGNQGNSWLEAIVDLTPYAGQNIRLRFDGEIGDYYQSDICIDNITFAIENDDIGGGGNTDPCDSPTFNFENPTLISGPGGQPGAVYLFEDVFPNVDARITYDSRSHNDIDIMTIDGPEGDWGGYDGAWQPIVDYDFIEGNNIESAKEKTVTFTIAFYDAGTTNPYYVPKFTATALDLDGSNITNLQEFVETTNYQSYQRQAVSDVTFSGAVRATGPDRLEQGDIDETALNVMVGFTYINTHSITVTYGADWGGNTYNSNGAETRYNSMYFKCYEFDTEECGDIEPPFAIDTTLCSTGLHTLYARGCDEGVVSWYDAPTGGNLLHRGNAFETNLTTSATYYLQCEINTCLSATRSTYNVNVGGLAADAGSDIEVCESVGSVTLNAGGGSNYSWSTGQTGSTIVVNPPVGTTTYTVTVTAGGCSGVDQVNVTVHPDPVVSIGGTPTVCLGGNTTLTANVTSGTPSYTYAWQHGPGSSSTTVQPIQDSLFTVFVSDSEGCQSSASTTVTIDNGPSVTVNDEIICDGSSVVIRAVASGGDGNYTYAWTGRTETTDSIVVSPSSTQTYQVVVSDGTSSCTADAVSTITVTSGLSVDLPTTSQVCDGSSVELSPIISGESSSLTYTWSTGESTSSIFVSPGITTKYFVTVSNTSGCSGVDSTVVNVNSNPVINMNGPYEFCYGGAVSIVTTVNGGSGGYTYQWEDGSTTSQLDVSPGATRAYSVTVTDSNGCSSVNSATVIVNELPNVIVPDQNICGGGSATLNAIGSGGTPGYTYTWSTAETGPSITVSPGSTTSYTVTIEDSKGCQSSYTATVDVGYNPVVTVDDDTICETESTVLTANSTGGQAPLTYLWSTGETTPSILVTPFSTQSYTVTVTDALGCSGVDSGTVTLVAKPVVQVKANDPDCDGNPGNVTLIFTDSPQTNIYFSLDGGETYPYVVDDSTDSLVIAQGAGTYDVWVSWGSDFCATDLPNVTIADYTALQVVPINDTTMCDGTLMTINPIVSEGTSPYTYNWSTGSFAPTLSVSPDTTTTYSVTISDNAGCSKIDTFVVTVYDNPVIETFNYEMCPEGSVNLAPTSTGGNGPYTYAWNFGISGDVVTVSPEATTTYTVTVTTSEGCTDVGTSTVTVLPEVTVVVPDAVKCEGSPTQLTATSSDGTGNHNFLWSTGETTSVITVDPAAQTDYYVTVTDDKGCTGIDTATVFILADPNTSIVAETDTACLNAPVLLTAQPAGFTYLWSANAGGSTDQSVSVTPSLEGDNIYSVTITTPGGCNIVENVIIYARPLPEVVVDDTDLCIGETATLSATASGGSGSGYTFEWSTGETTQSIDVSPTANATYFVTVTDSNGCTNVDDATINTLIPPSTSFTVTDTTVCEDGAATITVFPAGLTYEWSANAYNSTNQTVVVFPTISEGQTTNLNTYTVTITDVNGCTSVETIEIVTERCEEICGDGEDNDGDGLVDDDDLDCSCYEVEAYDGAVASDNATSQFDVMYYGTQSLIANNGLTGTEELNVNQVSPYGVLAGSDFTYEKNKAYYFEITHDTTLTGSDQFVFKFDTLEIKYDPSSWSNDANGIYFNTNAEFGTIEFENLNFKGVKISEINDLVITGRKSWILRPGDLSEGFTMSGYVRFNWDAIMPTADNLEWGMSLGRLQEEFVNTISASIDATGGTTEICIGETTNLSVNASGGVGVLSYEWSDGLGTDPVISVSPDTTTTYYVTITDGGYCPVVEEVTVTTKPEVVGGVTGDTEICAGATATLTASGGSSYFWSNGATSPSINVNPTEETTYTVQITNSFGCSVVMPVTVTIGSGITAAIDYNGSECLTAGSQLTATITDGGKAPFNYTWIGPSGPAGNTETITVTESGNYFVLIQDDNNCEQTLSGYVYEAFVPTIVNLEPEVCEGRTVTLSVNSPNVVSYLWDSNAGNSTSSSVDVIPSVPSSTYLVTITNSQGCEAVASSTVTVNAQANISLSSDTLCVGSTAVATASSVGTWFSNNAAIVSIDAAGVITANGAGTAEITFIDDDNSCLTDPITVTVRPRPMVNGSAALSVCNGDSFVLTTSGSGVNPLVYEWSNGLGSGASHTVIANGDNAMRTTEMYYVTITDGNGCINVDSTEVTIFSNPVPTVTSTNESCGLDNGAITFTFTDHPSRSTIELSIDNGTSWLEVNDMIGSYTFTGLVPDTYIAKARWNDNSCENTLTTVSILEDEAPIATATAVSSAGCDGSNQGSIDVVITDNPLQTQVEISIDGGLTYPYTASDNIGTFSIPGLGLGDYYVWVRWGDDSCPTQITTEAITIFENSTPVASIAGGNTVCEGDNITLTASGGDSYSWDTGSTDSTIVVSPTTTTTYEVVVGNAAGCTDTTSVTVTVSPELSSSIDLSASPCLTENSEISVDHLGGTLPYTYSWVGPSSFTGNTKTISITTSGTYFVTVTDALGCESATSAFVYQQFESVIINLDTDVCEGDSVDLSASAPPGSTFLWSANANNATTKDVVVYPTAPSSSYTVTVTNENGCSSVATAIIDVDEVPVLTLLGDDMLCLMDTTRISATGTGLWSSSNDAVASVSSNGLVTALSPGTAIINYTNNEGCAAQEGVAIQVLSPPVPVFNGVAQLCVGDSTTLSPNSSGTWTSLNSTVASVDNNGKVIALSPGITKFEYTDASGCSAVTTQQLVVSALPIPIVPTDIDLCIGATANAFPNTGGTWSSTDPSIATISNAGLITAVSAGKVAFIFTSNSTQCSSEVSDSLTVSAPLVDPIGSITLCVGEGTSLTAPGLGNWESENVAIASISSSGFVTGLAPGQTRFRFVDGNSGCVSDWTSYITVAPNPIITITGSSIICVGATTKLEPGTGGTWTSTNPAIATVDNNGLVTGVSSGQVGFTFVDNATGCAANTGGSFVIVQSAPNITLDGPSSLCLGSTAQLSPSNGGVWTSSDDAIATVSSTGIVISNGVGNVTFYFEESSSGCTSSKSLNMTIQAAPTITITGATELCVGETTQLTPTSGGVWESANDNVATISNTGEVTAVMAGVVAFRFVEDGGCSSDWSANILVNPVSEPVFVDGTNLCIGSTTNILPNTGGTWTSSNPAVASITDEGVITALAVGTATFAFTDTTTGCVSGASSFLTVDDGPVIVDGQTELCIAEETQLFPTTGGVWTSSDPSVATIDNSGSVLAISAGQVTFTFHLDGADCASTSPTVYTINPRPSIANVVLEDICQGDTYQIVFGEVGTWTSDNPSIATVTPGGLITGVSGGVVGLRFTNTATGCVSDISDLLRVIEPIEPFFIGQSTICPGSATNVEPSTGGLWSSSDEAVATVTDEGVVNAIAEGSTVLTFTDTVAGCPSTTTLLLNVEQGVFVSITGDDNICIGETTQLSPMTGGAWQSSNDAIATVTNGGRVFAHTPGEVIFTFISTETGCSGQASTAPVTVNSCVNDDFNVTTTELEINGDIATNDNTPSGTTYDGFYVVKSKPSASNPSLTINSDGTYTFSSDVPGKYVFETKVCMRNEANNCQPSLLEVTVLDNVYSAPNPVANLETALTFADGDAALPGQPVTLSSLDNDDCVYTVGCTLDGTVSIIDAPSNGTTSISGGDITYTPNAGFVGFDTLRYEVCSVEDAALCSETFQIILVQDTSATNSIKANDDFMWTTRGETVSHDVLSNTTDAEGDTYSITTQGSAGTPITTPNGSYYIESSGMLHFTPDDTFVGNHEIVYEVCDSQGACNKATAHILVFDDLTINLRVYLEGAIMNNGGEVDNMGRPLMRDDLRVSPFTGENVIPTTNPYKVSIDGYGFYLNNYYTSTTRTVTSDDMISDSLAMFSVTGQDAIVDWVYVELRSKSDSTQIIGANAGLVQRDGDVIGVDGSSGIRFKGVNADEYYVVVKHRMHLAAMSQLVTPGELVDFTDPSYPEYDFGQISPAFDMTGRAQNKVIVPGYRTLWAGDFNSDGKITFEGGLPDRLILLTDILSHPDNDNLVTNFDLVYGYYNSDYNMNAKSKLDSPNDDTINLYFQVLFNPQNSYYFSIFALFLENVPPTTR